MWLALGYQLTKCEIWKSETEGAGCRGETFLTLHEIWSMGCAPGGGGGPRKQLKVPVNCLLGVEGERVKGKGNIKVEKESPSGHDSNRGKMHMEG